MSSFILDIAQTSHNEISGEPKFSLEYSTSPKFKNDKVNYQNKDYLILLDGIVLNKKLLFNDNTKSGWPEYLIESYRKNGNQFFKQLKGSYYGFLYDKRKEKWIVFTDHIGSKPVYFAKYENHICFANNYTVLLNYLKRKNQKVTLNEMGAYLLLTYGWVFEELTIAHEIKRMIIGNNAVIHQGQMKFEKFYTLTIDQIEMSEDNAIEELDMHFKNAVQLAFEKDREYGYQHVAQLSGGLDSRMTVWVANELGYTNQLNLTFSQSNYLEEKIAKQIASDLKHEWLFKALDNGSFLENIDDTTQLTGGNILYFGLAHGISMYKYLNFDNLGIIHSGQMGNYVGGICYSSLDANKQFEIGDGAYSSILLPAIKQLKLKEEYPNVEIFQMYIRGFYGSNIGLLGPMMFSETFSPFYEINFMEFALSIPIALRFKYYLYKKWILKKYPEAAKYIWESDKVPVNYPYWIKIKGRPVPLKEIPTKVLAKLGYKKYGHNSKNHMNPLEYWYRTNTQLKTFMDNYYYENIHLLDGLPELQSGCKHLYFNTEGTEKTQVLSLLSALKTHCFIA